MPPKIKTKEERLAKQRLCKRRRYAEIKNDPELLAIAKEKRREKYLKDKEEKKVKNISEQTPRSQREQRKRWTENSKRYRQKKKQEKAPTFEAVRVIAGPSKQDEIFPREKEDPLQQDLNAALRKVRYTELKKRKKLLRIIATLCKKQKAHCRQIQRLKNKLRDYEYSRSSHHEMQNDPSVTAALDESYQNSLPSKSNTKERTAPLTERVRDFFLDYANSTVGAGKKEFIRKNQVRMQKRYLSSPLQDLYKKFRMQTHLQISYSFFCKLRPFWVVFRKKIDRDTCLCSVHLNMELLIKGLNKASIITEKNSEEVLSKVCCDKRSVDCLQRNCDVCKSNDIEHEEVLGTDCTFYEWKKVTKDVTLASGKIKKQTITEKTKNTLTATEALNKFKTNLAQFLDHNYKITKQYKSIKHLKENLNIQEALVHVDFSENYALKFGEEVQSFHFGGSRQQVSLHTAVIYTHNFSIGQVGVTSMCTMSDCLRHDAPAVWGHLTPLIEEVIKLNPFIDTIHFLSDSPSSQYRNKYMFYLITQISNDFPQLHSITWNYSEAGHGKGAPDGVGATLKRTADRMVMYGQDVGSFNQFYELMTRYVEIEGLKVIVRKVEENDIQLKASLIPNDLKPFKGTFSVYQATWNRTEPKTTLRKTSCFYCAPSEICEHGQHLGFIPLLQKDNIGHNLAESNVTLLAKTKANNAHNKKITILQDITLKNANLPLLQKEKRECNLFDVIKSNETIDKIVIPTGSEVTIREINLNPSK